MGPVSASIGRCTTMALSDHWAMVERCPPNVTLSPAPFAAPKPWPKRTTLVPTGPLAGSTRMLGISFRGTALLTLYWTGAQQDPSGKGSDEANRTTTSPDAAFVGTSTSMMSSFQRRGLTTTPPIITSLTPNIVFGSRGPAVTPKCTPAICTVWPGSVSAGVTAVIVGCTTVNVPAAIFFFPARISTGPDWAWKGTFTSI